MLSFDEYLPRRVVWFGAFRQIGNGWRWLGQESNPTTWKLAFYDALGESESAVEVLGDEQLRTIAREVAQRQQRRACSIQ